MYDVHDELYIDGLMQDCGKPSAFAMDITILR